MPEPQPLSPAKMKVCYIFLALGAVTLAFGLYMGFMKDGGSVVVFVLLGGSIALFALALLPHAKLYTYRIFNSATAEPQPEAKTEPQPKAKAEPEAEGKTEPQPEAKIEPQPKATAEPQPKATAEPQPKATAEPQPEATAEPQPEAKAESQPEAKIEVATLMNTTLGELLLATLIKDPEIAGRIVAQAIRQAEAPSRPRLQ
jgi:outer membrane biosynthesis protein TonB